MPNFSFVFDDKLGISLPELEEEWENYTDKERACILMEWEMIRGKIPDRIRDLEKEIFIKLDCLGKEDDFNRSCQLNDEISELAGTINDLQIWYRVNQEIEAGKSHN